MQNRKSAKKCRLKKKAEFSTLADEVDSLKKENKDMHDKVSLQAQADSVLARKVIRVRQLTFCIQVTI